MSQQHELALYLMKVFQLLSALLWPKPEQPVTPPSPYSDEEFLNAVMKQARPSPPAKQAATGAAQEPAAPGSLPKAA